MIRIEVTYFKASGKFYTNTVYETKVELVNGLLNMYEVSEEIKRMRFLKCLPGIVDGGDFFIHVRVLEDHGYPLLILPVTQ